MSRLVLSAAFDKPAGFKLKTGATVGSTDYFDYELVIPDKYTVGVEREDVIAFPPLIATSRKGGNTIGFQGGGNGEPFIFRVAHKRDDGGWILALPRIFNGFGPTPTDWQLLPTGTVAVSIIRMDAGRGAVGYCLDLEI